MLRVRVTSIPEFDEHHAICARTEFQNRFKANGMGKLLNIKGFVSYLQAAFPKIHSRLFVCDELSCLERNELHITVLPNNQVRLIRRYGAVAEQAIQDCCTKEDLVCYQCNSMMKESVADRIHYYRQEGKLTTLEQDGAFSNEIHFTLDRDLVNFAEVGDCV
ncbi:hypothetical protein BC829DRAFT_241498 [Chytridium lagenaria]|nr:hypothetical protein BC829DRAFT_241498 [Chytridium lagenaria]